MRLKIITKILAFVLFQLAAPAYADTGASAESEENAWPAEESSQAQDAPNKEVPKLNIVWGCGECVHNEKVIPLLERAYERQAATRNQSVSATDIAEVQIVEFNQRSPGLRVVFGPLSGKDRLGLKINHKGKEYVVRNFSANGRRGMNFLCEFIAKEAYWKLAASSN
ncbi:MAG TPA: hypothetical protein VFX02_09725 [Gammaproteobacteria bacterium]|nr:hypothetical protein [Gammaproteobacteria bacterium]